MADFNRPSYSVEDIIPFQELPRYDTRNFFLNHESVKVTNVKTFTKPTDRFTLMLVELSTANVRYPWVRLREQPNNGSFNTIVVLIMDNGTPGEGWTRHMSTVLMESERITFGEEDEYIVIHDRTDYWSTHVVDKTGKFVGEITEHDEPVIREQDDDGMCSTLVLHEERIAWREESETYQLRVTPHWPRDPLNIWN